MSTTATGIATREELLSYMNTGDTTEEWSLIGEGFSELSENLNPKTKESHYIHQNSGSSSVIGYAPTFDFTAEMNKGDAVATYIATIGHDRKVGAACETDIVNVYAWMKGKTEGTLMAYKQHIAVRVDNAGSGAGGDSLALTGALLYKGDAIKGEWDPITKTFTETA